MRSRLSCRLGNLPQLSVPLRLARMGLGLKVIVLLGITRLGEQEDAVKVTLEFPAKLAWLEIHSNDACTLIPESCKYLSKRIDLTQGHNEI